MTGNHDTTDGGSQTLTRYLGLRTALPQGAEYGTVPRSCNRFLLCADSTRRNLRDRRLENLRAAEIWMLAPSNTIWAAWTIAHSRADVMLVFHLQELPVQIPGSRLLVFQTLSTVSCFLPLLHLGPFMMNHQPSGKQTSSSAASPPCFSMALVDHDEKRHILILQLLDTSPVCSHVT